MTRRPATVAEPRISRATTTQSALSLPHAPASAFRARQQMARAIDSAGVSAHVIDDALIVLSELVGNAVRHAHPLPGGRIEVGWEVDDDFVVLEVADGGPNLQAASRVDPVAPDEAGRGLFLVTALSEDVLVDRQAHRSVTRATLRRR